MLKISIEGREVTIRGQYNHPVVRALEKSQETATPVSFDEAYWFIVTNKRIDWPYNVVTLQRWVGDTANGIVLSLFIEAK